VATSRHFFAKTGLVVTVLILVYVALLRYPQLLFAYTSTRENLTLRSDQPFSPVAGNQVLALVQRKLTRSPLYSSDKPHIIFICNARWRQLLFFNKDYGVGGIAPYPLSDYVFLRDADINANQLISPHGVPVGGDRTLDYFIAHELTHQLTGHAIGLLKYYQLPQWVREGYADHVGKGDSFDYPDAKNAFLAESPDMNWKRSGLYLRFHLFVAYLLDHQHWTVARLLSDPPSEEMMESSLKMETP
jgi:hypothetical protein